MQIPFDNSYARLPERFFERRPPMPVASARLVRLNEPLARELGLDSEWLASPDGLAVLAGNRVPEHADPIAQAYAGHQFGHFVPRLGDGRAVLLGEVVDREGRRRDIQLKGSGRTAFSRGGDGRAAVGPVLREYVVSEAMTALGVPTSRALAAVTTGEHVLREVPLPGAILTRVAASHIRIGTFQYFAARGDRDAVRLLAEHVIERHYPEAAQAQRPFLTLLQCVAEAQATLVARWMLVGFIHGVMNTDNMAVSGETIDYGPCAFMDAFHPGTVYSSIDHGGRYAYGNQPQMALWNLSRFAETLLPLIDDNEDEASELAVGVLDGFVPFFERTIEPGWCRKIGLPATEAPDAELALELLRVMAGNGADMTLTFRALGDELEGPPAHGSARALFDDPTAFDAWAARWRERLAATAMPAEARRAAMHAVNPRFIPRNHRVEAVIAAAVEQDDYGPFNELVDVLERPFEDQPGREAYASPPKPEERVTQTFCGT